MQRQGSDDWLTPCTTWGYVFPMILCLVSPQMLPNTVCATYEDEGIVCPLNLARNIFTTAAVDNIDHNPSSTTASDSFHGTGISLMQHPTATCQGMVRENAFDRWKCTIEEDNCTNASSICRRTSGNFEHQVSLCTNCGEVC